MMFSTLKSALVVGTLACIAAATPLSTSNISQPVVSQPAVSVPAAYQGLGLPMPSVVTMTRLLTIVVSNVPVDCAHGPLPTQPPAPTCDLSNFLRPVTSTRQYCGGMLDLPPGINDVEEDIEEEDVDNDEDIDEDDVDYSLDGHDEPRLNRDCTAVVMEGPDLTLSPTFTVYTSTTTFSRYVNCGPCTKASPVPYYSPGIAPVVSFVTTVTALQPSTTTLLQCEPQVTADADFSERDFNAGAGVNLFPPAILSHVTKVDPWPPAITSYTDFPPGATEASCVRIYHLFPSRLGKTRKIYTATHTTTASKECGHCALIWATGAYPVPVGPLPTTVTKKGKSTVTAMVCKTK